MFCCLFFAEEIKVEIKTESPDACTEPGKDFFFKKFKAQ